MKYITMLLRLLFLIRYPTPEAKLNSVVLGPKSIETRYPQVRSLASRVATEQIFSTSKTEHLDHPEIKIDDGPNQSVNGKYEKKLVTNFETNSTESGFKISKAYGSQGFDAVVAWLIKNLLPAASNGILFGKSQSYKTFVLIEIACCIATGRDFSNLPTKQGLVFIIAAEGGNGISKRIRAWELHHNIEVGEKLIVIPHAIFPHDEIQQKCLISEIEYESRRQGCPVALVIFDTLSQCSNGLNENEAGGVSKYLLASKSIGEPFGATVINVHHTNKKGDEFRGSSTLVSNVDFLLSMKREQDNFTKLKPEKMKEGSTNFQWELKLDCLEIDAVDEEGESLNTLCVTDVVLNNIDSTTNQDEFKPAQYKVDADWIKEHLTLAVREERKTLGELRLAMSNEFSIPDDAFLKVRIDRAKKHLLKLKLISSFKEGKEVYICLVKNDNNLT